MKKEQVSIADPPPIREWEEAAAKLAAQYINDVDFTSDGLVTRYRQISNLNLLQLRAVTQSLFEEVLRLQIQRGDNRGLLKDALKEIQKAHDGHSRGGDNKKAGDPKQAAKNGIFLEFQRWESGKERHASTAAFARHVVNKFGPIEATKSVERWVTRWRRESKKMKPEK